STDRCCKSESLGTLFGERQRLYRPSIYRGPPRFGGTTNKERPTKNNQPTKLLLGLYAPLRSRLVVRPPGGGRPGGTRATWQPHHAHGGHREGVQGARLNTMPNAPTSATTDASLAGAGAIISQNIN